MYVTIYEVYLNKNGHIDDFREYVAPNGKKLHSIPEVLKWFDDLPRSIGDWGESVTVNDHGNTRLFITQEGLETTRRTINSRLIGRTYGFYGPKIDFLDKYGRERNIDYDNRVRFSYRRCRIEKL